MNNRKSLGPGHFLHSSTPLLQRGTKRKFMKIKRKRGRGRDGMGGLEVLNSRNYDIYGLSHLPLSLSRLLLPWAANFVFYSCCCFRLWWHRTGILQRLKTASKCKASAGTNLLTVLALSLCGYLSPIIIIEKKRMRPLYASTSQMRDCLRTNKSKIWQLLASYYYFFHTYKQQWLIWVKGGDMAKNYVG